MEELASGFVNSLVRMCAEVVSQGLEQIGRQTVVTITIKISKGCAYSWHRNTHLDGSSYNPPPVTATTLPLISNKLSMIMTLL
jgi:hypothetical protein